MVKNKIKYNIHIYAAILLISVFFTSCSINYSFTGVNLSRDIKTYSVYYFSNRARLVNPTLSQLFTEELKNKLQRQSPLKEAAENGDLVYEGFIENYDVKPMSIQKDDAAAQNRLTITVRVKYTNSIDTEQSFERTFSAYEDFDSSRSLSDVEDSIVPDIINKIIEDLFNSTIANW
jgi:hypothetical protein